MARNRVIKAAFWDDEKLPMASRDARLTYIGMWNQSDDFGVVRGSPAWLKSKIYPHEEISLPVFRKWLEELEKIDRILPYEVNEEKFYYIPTFLDHQKVDRPNPAIRNPLPPKELVEGSPIDRRKFVEASTKHRVPREGKGREGKGREEKGREVKEVCSMPPELAALELYAADTKLVGKWTQLLKSWNAAYPYLDVVAEVRKAHAWELVNPKRRKRDRPRFLGGWMSRADDWRTKHKGESGRSREDRLKELGEGR